MIALKCAMDKKGGSPSVLDRLEFDIEVASIATYNTVFCGYIDSIGSGTTNNGEGEDISFVHLSTGQKNTWFALNGTSSYTFTTLGKKTRWMEFSGTMRLNLSYIYTSQSNLNLVTRIIIPSYCGIVNTSTTKVMTNCTDAFFPSRTYEQVKNMNANMSTMFANSIWHCSDGDFHANGTPA